MNEEVQQLLAHALRRSRHPGVREHLARCTAPGAGLEELYAASGLALAPSDGPADVALAATLAKAINLEISHADRTTHVGRLAVRREAPRVPVASRGRPALLAFDRAIFDGTERETTVMLPQAGALVDGASDEAAEAFFASIPDVPLRPEATGRLVELAGDTSARPRRELQADVVSACADNIAMLARHRDERPQWERGENEDALLANVDAIGACGGECVRLLVEWWRAADDPWKTWAAVFALASFTGTDTLGAIAGELEELPNDADDHVLTAAEALLVAPHPHITELALDLSTFPNPVARAVGIEVLARRRLLAPDLVRRHLCDANHPVLAAAMRASGILEPKVGIALVLPFLHHPDGGVAWFAARQLMRWQRSEPYFETRQGRCRALGSKALEVLIQFGDTSDIDSFQEIVASGHATSEVLSAVARFGEPSVWVYLIHHLSDPELAEAAARALVTLFGPLVSRRDGKNAAAWRDAVATCEIVPGARLRAGRPWHPAAVASECLRGEVDRAELQVRIDELGARCGAVVDVDLALWSPDVDARLGPAMLALERATAGFRAGSWDCKSTGFRG